MSSSAGVYFLLHQPNNIPTPALVQRDNGNTGRHPNYPEVGERVQMAPGPWRAVVDGNPLSLCKRPLKPDTGSPPTCQIQEGNAD